MNPLIDSLYQKLEEYKKKYYKNLLIKGGIMSLALTTGSFLFINFLEYFGRFGSSFRAILLVSFIALCIYTLFFLIVRPLLYFFKIKEPFSNLQAATDIGKFFPNVGDKLLNTLQLANISNKDNSLLLASIEQKSNDLKFVKFADAINLNENKKYLKYAIPPVLALLLISAISPSFFKSSQRIINFNKEFAPEAPFSFKLLNQNLNAVKNEDYTLKLKIEGNTLPEEVYLVYNDRRFKMEPAASNNNEYAYTFTQLQEPIEFNFYASGFNSDSYEIDLLSKPEILSFDVQVNYPAYLKKPAEQLKNVGNMIVPEGTTLSWNFKTTNADSLNVAFNTVQIQHAYKLHTNGFNFARKMMQSADYQVLIKNKMMENPEKMNFYINVIPDKLPEILLNQMKDTVNFNYIVLGGNIADDYGLTAFNLYYRKNTKGTAKANMPFTKQAVAFNKAQLSQAFYHQFDIYKLQLEQDEELEYYLELYDNDGVNGPKAVRTSTMVLEMPSNKEFDAEIEKQVESTEDKLEEALRKSKELKKAIDNLDKQLKTKKELDFQTKKQLEDILKKKEELQKQMNDLQKQMDQLQEKQNRFQEQSPELQQKMDQLQNLLDELMKDKESDVFKELEKMTEEQDEEKLMEQLQKLQQKERNTDREIDRALKLFKDLQLKQKVEQVSKELEKLADKQEDLADKTQKEKEGTSSEEIKKEQEKIEKAFKEEKEKLKDIEKLSKELRKEMDTDKQEQQEAAEQMDKAQKQMDAGENKESSKSQKKAAKSMRNLAQQMGESMKSAEMKQLDLDIDALRDILENLVKLSFDQESLMKKLRGISKSDPRFVELSQQQLKLVDDAKIVEDSLFSLAQTVMQIEATITKEVTDMKNSMDESIQLLKDRKLPQASAKQQFSMTSINNLALMLSDTFKQMQQMMAAMMPGSGKGGKDGQMPSPGLGEQQQQLNDKMKGLGQSGMNGAEVSKQLAKMANDQARIRKQLKEMQDRMNGTEGGKKVGGELEQLQKQMEEQENELINKRINSAFFKRQQQIETRLLEAEKAIKEQELDPKRKAKSAVSFERTSPPSLEKFMQEKQKQQELIRTTPPNFTPFYKKQTDDYFNRIK